MKKISYIRNARDVTCENCAPVTKFRGDLSIKKYSTRKRTPSSKVGFGKRIYNQALVKGE